MGQTFNPILEDSKYQNSFFPIIPVPSPGTEVILYASISGKKILITQTAKLKPKDIYKGKYDRKIVVDMRAQTVSFREKYGSKNIGVYFIVEVKAAVKVTEADIVWESGIHDVAASLEQEITSKIGDIACNYEISNVMLFQRHLKQQMGTLYLIGTGITIQGINYSVEIEEKYNQLFRQEYYEEQLSKSASEIQKMYENGAVAVFAEVAAQKISPEEAYERVQKSLSSNFDERMRQLREATQFLNELREKDFVNKEQITIQIEQILGSLSIVDSKMERHGQERNRLIVEKEDESVDINERSAYEPFDD